MGRELFAVPARLDGYERGRTLHYFISARPGVSVRGAILRALSARDFSILDEYEDVPTLYTRERVVVRDGRGGRLGCWVYLPTGWECA